MINLGYFVVSIYLAIVVFYYYNKTSIPDYAIFGGFYIWLAVFAGASLGHLINPEYDFFTSIVITPDSDPIINILYFISSISGYLFYFLINLYFARGISNEFSIKLRKINRIALVINISMYVPIIFGQLFYFQIAMNNLVILRYSTFMTILCTQLAILRESLLQFRDSKKHYFYNDKIATSWKIAIILTIISGITFLIKYAELLISFFTSRPIVVINPIYLMAIFIGLVATTIVMVMSILVPQSLLVFRYQIIRAVSLYPRRKQDINDEPMTLSKESIAAYLERLTTILDIDTS